VASREGVGQIYSDLAKLKALILQGSDMAPEARIAALKPLAAPGAPFQSLALEQQALAEVAAGRKDDAVATLRELMNAAATTPGLRQRASQMIVALGKDPAAS